MTVSCCPTHIFGGVCFNCARGDSAACLRVHPGHVGGAYAMPGMGPFRGSQAELVRVPFADANCVVLPGVPGDEHEDYFVPVARRSPGAAGSFTPTSATLSPWGW